MKRLFIYFTVIVLILCLAGCNGTAGGANTDATDTQGATEGSAPSESESHSGVTDSTTQGEDTDGVEIYYDAPLLTVICGDFDVEADSLSCIWCWENFDGTSGSINTDGRHPLDIKEGLATLVIDGEDNRLLMAFDSLLMPVSVTVLCWPEEYESEASGEPALEITLTDPERQTDLWGGYSFELLDGNYVYKIKAKWEKDPDGSWNQYGTAYYGFKTNKTE